MDIVASILYVATFCLACGAIVLHPKTKSRISPIGWAAVSFFLLLSIDGIAAGIFTLLHIPSNLISATLVHTLLIGWSGFTISKKGRQALTLDFVEVLVAVAFLVVTALCARAEFGPNLTLHYITSDPANHLSNSMQIYETNSVHSMYMAWNFVAQVFAVLSPFTSAFMLYKGLILSDIVFLLFGGLLPYALATTMIPSSNKLQRIVAGIGSLLYLLGYPLNGMLYGFFYLGVGVAMAACAVVHSFLYWNEQKTSNALGIAISLAGLILSYSLFAPLVFLVCFVVVFLANARKAKQPWKRTLILIIVIFILPGVLGLVYSYGGFFGSGSRTIAGSIAAEGAIYRNLYSSLLLFAPLSICGIYRSMRDGVAKNRLFPLAAMIIGLFAFMGVCLALSLNQVISTYYYFKFYYLLSPFFFTCAILGTVFILQEKTKALLVSSLSVIIFCGIMVAFDVDSRIPQFEGRFNYGIPQSYHPAFDIYSFNLDQLQNAPELSPNVMELYEKAAELANDTDNLIPVLSSWYYEFWYAGLVRQNPTYEQEYLPWANEPAELAETIDSNCDYYVVVTIDASVTEGNPGIVESLETAQLLADSSEIVYSNDAGYVARVID